MIITATTTDGLTWTADWKTNEVPDGRYCLIGEAWDAAGNVGTSTPVCITVMNEATTTPPIDSGIAGWVILGLIVLIGVAILIAKLWKR